MPGKLLSMLFLATLAAEAPPLEIVIQVANKAGLSQGFLRRAMNEVVDIFAREGFAVRWSMCDSNGENRCRALTGYLICISPDHGTRKPGRVALGYALLGVARATVL